MVDTGAQVGCIHSCMLDLYPMLKKYFIPKKEVLKGVGSIICEVEGSLHRLPICLGTQQSSGSLFYVDLKVVQGRGY